MLGMVVVEAIMCAAAKAQGARLEFRQQLPALGVRQAVPLAKHVALLRAAQAPPDVLLSAVGSARVSYQGHLCCRGLCCRGLVRTIYQGHLCCRALCCRGLDHICRGCPASALPPQPQRQPASTRRRWTTLR